MAATTRYVRSPFTIGTVASAPVFGAIAGGAALNVQGTTVLAIGMALGAAVAVAVCSWWPKLSAPGWKLWSVGAWANPLFLLGFGFSLDHYGCFVGRTTGWDCILAQLGPLLCGLCLLPPLAGLGVRWWYSRRMKTTSAGTP